MNSFITFKNNLVSALGKPYFETDSCILFCGDTLYMQKQISGDIFDAIITSPPYNIGKEYESVMPVNMMIFILLKLKLRHRSLYMPTEAMQNQIAVRRSQAFI